VDTSILCAAAGIKMTWPDAYGQAAGPGIRPAEVAVARKGRLIGACTGAARRMEMLRARLR
jgi:hypothetical protein